MDCEEMISEFESAIGDNSGMIVEKEDKKNMAKKISPKKPAAKKSKYVESDSESDKESFVESEEEEQEYVPKKGKRGPPVERSAIPAKKVAKKPQSGN